MLFCVAAVTDAPLSADERGSHVAELRERRATTPRAVSLLGLGPSRVSVTSPSPRRVCPGDSKRRGCGSCRPGRFPGGTNRPGWVWSPDLSTGGLVP